MDIFWNVLFLIIGLVLLIKGADFFVSGASAVAKKFKVSPLIIGLTIVAIGTSLPELAVSITSAISGSLDMSVGNVLGSNMANMLLILGIVAIMKPIPIKASAKSFDLPMMMLVTCLLFLFSSDIIFNNESSDVISRTEGIVLVGIFVFFIYMNVKFAKRQNVIQTAKIQKQQELLDNAKEQTDDKNDKSEKPLKVWQVILYLIFGLAAVVFGGECVSRTSQFLAVKAGMSEALVGLTIVAVGTSLPELATSIVAAKKGEVDLAVGNIVGSNIMNIVMILGIVGIITPIPVSSLIFVDLIILIASTFAFTIMALTRMRLSRGEGVTLLVIYLAYIAFAIVRNYCF
ncbi:MAG: calcium/sodium antiporter [Clostridia bacterium]|nr:calcium/sodium antiporter [Clostridia bacterium]